MQTMQFQSYHDPRHPGVAIEWPWLRGYIVKLDNNRVNGGKVLAQCIQEKGLHLLRVPKQYPFPVPKLQTTLSIGEKIEGSQGEEMPISLPQCEQLITLIRHARYSDPKWRNLLHCADGSLGIIDTECFGDPIYGLHALWEKNTLTEEAADQLCRTIKLISPYPILPKKKALSHFS
jgi:hypothetical protein